MLINVDAVAERPSRVLEVRQEISKKKFATLASVGGAAVDPI